MSVEHYRVLFEYNTWANGRLLERIGELGESEYTRPAGLYHGNGSIRATLVHMLGTEEAWLERSQGRDLAGMLAEGEVPTMAALQTRWGEAAEKWGALLSQVTDVALDAPVTNTSPRSGRTFTNPLWARLAHVLHHGSQHRSEVALLLTQLGRSPGDLDFLPYHALTSGAPA